MENQPPPLREPALASGAGFGIRFLARFIDVAMSFFLGLVGGLLAGILLALLHVAGAIAPGWEHRIQGFSAASLVLSLFGGLLYHALTEGIHGASLGKLVCKLRVVTADGHPCTIGRALLRSLAYYWDALFFGLIGYHSMKKSPLNQRYGDVWAKTLVVRSRDIPPSAARPLWKFPIAFVLGTACWVFMLALAPILRAAW